MTRSNQHQFRFVCCILLGLSLLFMGCESQPIAEVTASPKNDYVSASQAELPQTSYVETLDIGQTDDTSETVEHAFRGDLSPVTRDIPLIQLAEELNKIGIDQDLAFRELEIKHNGEPYFSVDLRQLIILGITEKQEILCKLRCDTDTAVLFLLDSEKPNTVKMLVRDKTELDKAPYSILLDDHEVNEVERSLCEKLLEIHLDSGDSPRCIYLDRDVNIHFITCCFSMLEGLQYHLRFDEYLSEDKEIAIYSNSEDAFVWTGVQMPNTRTQ